MATRKHLTEMHSFKSPTSETALYRKGHSYMHQPISNIMVHLGDQISRPTIILIRAIFAIVGI